MTSDNDIKDRIVTLLTQAGTEAGTPATATERPHKGPFTITTIRALIGNGVHTTTVTRLVNELVDATTIVRNMNNSPDTAKWTYTIA